MIPLGSTGTLVREEVGRNEPQDQASQEAIDVEAVVRRGTAHLYVDPDTFADLRDFVQHGLRSDWTSALAAELLKTSRVSIIKQARFRRGLMMTVVSFIVLGGEQFVRSLAMA